MSCCALVAGLALGLLQPLFVVGIGVSLYAGPTYLGLFFLLCVGALVLVGLLALFVRGAREIGLPVMAASGCLAVGMLGGNWLAATLHVGIGAPRPLPEIHPTGTGWSATGNLLVGRSHHTATLLRDGRVLVAGGTGAGNEGVLSSAELYDPARGTWSATGSMLAPHSDHSATLLGDGRVLVTAATGEAELYDPGTGTWSATGRMSTPRTSYAVTLLRDGRVLVSGGDPGVASEREFAPPELFDPLSGTWSVAGTMHVPRSLHTATLLDDGRVLIAGGQGTEASESNPMGLVASAELYDPASGAWTVTGDMQAPRSGHAAVMLPDGRVLVVGGLFLAATTEVFDPLAGTWMLGGQSEGGTGGTQAILLSDGRVVVVNALGGIEVVDPLDPSSRTTADTGRWGATATLLTDGTVLFAGGAQYQRYGVAAVHLYHPE